MRILSFDCGTINLGVTCILFDEYYADKINNMGKKLNNIYSSIIKKQLDKEAIINNIKEYLIELNNILSNIINIEWINTVNLIGNKSINDVNNMEIYYKLKYFLSSLDQTVGKPDKVLIEYQMGPNAKANKISDCISYHYMELNKKICYGIINKKNKYKRYSSEIAFNKYKLSEINLSDDKNDKNVNDTKDDKNDKNINDTKDTKDDKKINNTKDNSEESYDEQVILINPGLKNTYSFTNEIKHECFLLKYTNYTANKKHTESNFLHFLNVIKGEKYIKELKTELNNKLFDVSDSFMAVIAWLKKEKYI